MRSNKLLIEAIECDSKGRIQDALDIGASLKARSRDGLSVLEVAQKYAAHQAARFLIEKGVDVNVRTKSGDTLLHRAARQGDYGFVSLLLEYKADTELRDRYRRRAIDVAKPKEGFLYDLLEEQSKLIQPVLFR